MNDSLQTRREFLRRGIFFLAAGATAPFFLTRTAHALDQALAQAGTRSLPGMPDGRILVVIQLGGGNDGLNTLVPYALDEYHTARPTLAIAGNAVLKLNDTLGLHPALAKLKELHDAGKLAIVHGVGYPNPDRSHFRSMEIWQTGDPTSQSVTYGWLGRYLDNTCPGCDPRTQTINPVAGISLGGAPPLAMKSKRGLSITLDNPDNFQWQPPGDDKNDARRAGATFEKLNRIVAANLQDPHLARLDFLSRVAMNAQVSSERIRAVAKKSSARGSYPASNLARQLALVAQMIGGGLDTRLYYVSMGGFDTHANQAATHERLLTELAEAVAAFQADLEERREADRVLTMTFSEFGRRVAENGSAGTDHGAAAPLFVIGKRIKPGLHGTMPSLKNLDRGDLRFTTDFRSVYATVLENWLGAKAPPILGQKFETLKFV